MKPPKHWKHDSFSLNYLPLSFSFPPYPEPFEQDVTETDSVPPNLPKIPTTSSSPPPVNHSFSPPTSSHSLSNTTGPSGESCWCPLCFYSPALHHHILLYLRSFRQPFSLHCPLSSPTMLSLPPLLTALSCLHNSPDLSLTTSCLCALSLSLQLWWVWACRQCV